MAAGGAAVLPRPRAAVGASGAGRRVRARSGFRPGRLSGAGVRGAARRGVGNGSGALFGVSGTLDPGAALSREPEDRGSAGRRAAADAAGGGPGGGAAVAARLRWRGGGAGATGVARADGGGGKKAGENLWGVRECRYTALGVENRTVVWF